jgi:YidC/Oxa1 family membrane protein insertase
MKFFWSLIFYNPLYNLLVFFVSISPYGDMGVAVILLTILVKIVLFPLSKKAIVSQYKLKSLQPKIEKIKKETNDKQLEAQKTFALYKEEGVNPFSSCLVLLIQLPILFALYYVFLSGMNSINQDILYPFIKSPQNINNVFLGLIDLTRPSIFLAIFAGISQYLQLRNQPIPNEKPENDKDTQAMIVYSMTTQMKYILPVIIVIVSFKLPAALSLYWVVSNVITIIQERSIKKSLVA